MQKFKKINLGLMKFRVEEANAQTNLYTNGFPGITNFVGFGKAIAVKFLEAYPKYQKIKFDFVGVAISIHEMQVKKDHPKYVRYKQSDWKGNDSIVASTIDARNMFMTLSLFISFNFDKELAMNEDEIFDNEIQDNLINFITTYYHYFKLAGGRIYLDAKKPIQQFDNINEFLRLLPFSNYILEDNFHLIVDKIDDVFQLFTHQNDDTPKTEYLGKYFLLQTGYQLLEMPQKKSFSRNNYPHAFSEAILKPVRVRMIASLRKEDVANLLWHYDYINYSSKKQLLVTAKEQSIK